MYNSNYEDYMRNVLGYNIMPQDTYSVENSMYELPHQRNIEMTVLEGLYPEIYRMVYPMIQKVCMRAGNVINEELIEKMTDEVYRVLEENDKENENLKRSTDTKTASSQQTRRVEETRSRNYMLRDLIKILILRELLGGRPPMRPPMPPPMQPRPPMRPQRY